MGERWFEAVAPADRATKFRRCARVLLLDDDGKLLLFADSDPGIAGVMWWITPGGGVDPGETDRQAALRELTEETGAILADDQLTGPVAIRRATHGYSNRIVVQDEIFYTATVPAFEIDTSGHTEEEKLTMTGHRWWTREELESTEDDIWPSVITEMLDLDPAEFPLELGEQEESTIPV